VQVAREIKVNETTFGHWVKGYRESMPKTSHPFSYPNAPGFASWRKKTESSR
jgi:hypothetical protein